MNVQCLDQIGWEAVLEVKVGNDMNGNRPTH